MGRKSYYENIEWEMLKYPLKFYVQDFVNFGNEINISTVKFERNEEYDIIGKFEGIISKEQRNNLDEFNDINFSKIFIMESEYEKISFNYEKTINIEYIGQKYTILFYVSNLEKKVNYKQQISFISEWYINGPKARFNRVTHYVKDEKYTKERKINSKSIIKQNFNFPESIMSTLKNYLYIKPDNCPNFIISKVFSDFNPKWSNNISIEFYEKYGFPDDESKQIIYEILSFIFGRHIIKIGESWFDENGYCIYEKSISPDIPFPIDIQHICNDYDYSPIDYDDINKDKHQIEKDISLLIDKYIESNVDYNNVFNYLRNSILLPPQSEIVLLGGALDYLITELRKKYNINDEYISKKEFEECIGDELSQINKKLNKYPKLLNNLNKSYKKKGTSKFDEVFHKLNLEIGELEDNAIRYRHIPAHGHKMKQKTKNKFPILVAVYRTLLNRCILKSLDYENDYFDVISKCNRSINKAIPKKEFDKILDDLN